MTRCVRALGLAKDERGATVMEFAFVAPVMCLLLVGGLDVGHTLYMRATLQGALQKAARDSSLENGSARGPALDNMIREQVLNLANNAEITFSRRAFTSYGQAERVHEPWTDSETPGDGTCNHGEPYVDENNDGSWTADLGRDGQGGSKDAVVYRVTVSYPAMLPLWRFINGSDHVTVEATTVLRNQPYGEQARAGSETRNCPA